MTRTFCIFIIVILLILYIIDFKQKLVKSSYSSNLNKLSKIEQFKSEILYTQNYLNDPNKINNYRKQKEIDENKSKYKINSLTSVNKIQSNEIQSMNLDEMGEKDKLYVNLSNNLNKDKIYNVYNDKNYLNFIKNQQLEHDEYNKYKLINSDINNGDIYRKSAKHSAKHSTKHSTEHSNLISIQSYKEDSNKQIIQKVKEKVKEKVKFNPIISNPESKYKLYHDSLFTPKSAPKLYSENTPIVDQSINTNIIDYVNKGKQSIPIDYENPSNTVDNINISNINMKGRTIKDIYDEITNDSRLDLQKNLDNLEVINNRNDYILGEKYGSTRFDTYALG